MGVSLSMLKAEKRETVWVNVHPGEVLPGVVIWRRFGFVRVLYWDDCGEHFRITLFRPSITFLSPRIMEPWSRN